MTRTFPIVLGTLLLAGPAVAADVNEANEAAMKAASARVAPSVVKIETAGGTSVINPPPPKPGTRPNPGVRKGSGPTTGIVVDADGFVITSSFNFANKPTDIFVTVPGRPARMVAKVIATDQSRMLTLLKVDAKNLPVAVAVPRAEIHVGRWAMALGRTLDPNADNPPSMSAGIVSALNRVWGKAIQTDAKVSPNNYGGPLTAIDGRVFGVLVPASPMAEGETAGVEWYDSGIGFAIPLEDILARLPDLKAGKTLRAGVLGLIPKEATSEYLAPPVVGTVQPDSAAARAGVQVDDKILRFDGKPVPNDSAFRHLLGPKYEGDTITLVVERGGKEVEVKDIKLLGSAASYVAPFLGVLPMRDDPGPGVQVRFVYPNSPAERAGIKEGDRLTAMGPAQAGKLAPIQNRAQLAAFVGRFAPNDQVKFDVRRKEGGKTDTVTVALVPMPDAIPEKLPLPSSLGEKPPAKKDKDADAPKKDEKKDDKEPIPPPRGGESFVSFQPPKKNEFLDPKKDEPKKVETGFLTRTNEALGREYWVYVPDNYDPKVSHGLIVWFHPAGQGGKDGEKMSRTFREFAEDHHFILMGPKSQTGDGWVPNESDAVIQDVKAVLGQYAIDKSRVIAHGMGLGGQMAFYVGFSARDVFRGVATIGAVLGTNPRDNVPAQPLSFFVAGGDKDPIIKDIAASKTALEEKRFPVIYRELKEAGKEYFDAKTFGELLAWMDSLDRI